MRYPVYGIAILLVYFKLWRSYFTQDEWYYFGLFNPYINNPLGFYEIFLQQFTHPKLFGIHFTPLRHSLYFLEYQLFGLQYQYYALLAMVLHAISATGVSALAQRLTKSLLVSTIAGFYYAIGYMQYEGVTWADAHINSQVPVILVLVSFILWIRGVDEKNKKLLYTAVSLILIGLLIKESILGMFLVLGLLGLTRTKKGNHSFFIKPLLVGILLYAPFRILLPILLRSFDTSTELASPIPVGIFDISSHLYRLLFYPFKALLQQFINPDTILYLSEVFTKLNYPRLYAVDSDIRGTMFLNFVNSAGADIIMLILSIPLGLFLWRLYKHFQKKKEKMLHDTFLFCLLVVISAVLPLLLLAPWLLTLFTYVTFIESRHFSLISVGTSILLGVIIYEMLYHSRSVLRNNGAMKRFIMILVLLVVGLFFIREISYARNNIERIIALGEERKIIVDYITAVHPTIADTSIFYITSNKQYFGLSALMVPFQTNFGYTLLSAYHPQKKYDDEFFTSGFLVEKGIDGEAYLEKGGKGFGYFIRGNTLIDAVKRYDIPLTNIYAFHYNGASKIIESTSESIRTRIQAENTFEEYSRDWDRYTDAKNQIAILHSPELSITEEEQEIGTMVSVQTIEYSYGITIYSEGKGKNLDEFVHQQENLGTKVFEKKKMYFKNLSLNDVVIVRDGSTIRYYFYHVKTLALMKLVLPTEAEMHVDQVLWNVVFL